jgi:hypothetical protein
LSRSRRESTGAVKVAHLTTAHAPDDVRIYVKECATLAAAGFEVVVVGPATGAPASGTVPIRPIPAENVRWRRMLLSPWHLYRAAARERAEIYHFHDPELLGAALLLKMGGARVVYDVHEDLPVQILGKAWIPGPLRRPVGGLARLAERLAAAVFDLVVAATPVIADRFPPGKTVLVRNMPLLDELVPAEGTPFPERSRTAVYVGAITEQRGARQMAAAAALLAEGGGAGLVLAGELASEELRELPGWSRVCYVGWQSRTELRRTLADVQVGLLPLLPAPNYVTSLPTKLFEYMSAGLPVVASDFPLWREIVHGAGCGLLVDPEDPAALARAVMSLLDEPERAQQLGARGRAAVEREYNWPAEGERLVAAYRALSARPGGLGPGGGRGGRT